MLLHEEEICVLPKNKEEHTVIFEISTFDGNLFEYDNISNEIFTKDGGLLISKHSVDFFDKPNVGKIVDPFDTVDFSSLKKDRNINKLRIQVGLGCNYKCEFCIQREYGNSINKVYLHDGVVRLLDNLDKNKIKVSEDARIEIWGGEPLVYFKTLKYLLPELNARYKNCRIKMISNGTLLNEDKARFLIENKVNTIVSHDAQAYFLRGKDPLEDERMRRLWNDCFYWFRDNKLWFGINTVISQYNVDLFAIQNFFAKKLNKDIKFGFEGVVMAHAKNSVEFTKFNKHQRDVLSDSIRRAIFIENESNVANALAHRVIEACKHLAFNIDSRTIKSRCDAANSNILSIDMEGNILSCHNVDSNTQKLGNINDFENVKCNKFTHWSRRVNCPSCPYLISCKGSCMRNNDQMHNEGCDVQKIFHGAIFDCAWELVTGSRIKSIRAKR